MKIAIMGAGGVGGFYGGRMARAGEEVLFIARGRHLAALRRDGLRVESPAVGDFHLPRVEATDDPASAGQMELICVTTKSYDLEEAARAIRPMVGAGTVVLPLLNGLDATQRLGAIVGPGHVMGGVAYVSAHIASPGVIRHIALDRLVFGELNGAPSPRGEAIAAMLRGAGIEAKLSDDIIRESWVKFIVLNAMAGVASLTRATAGQLVSDPDTRAMLNECMAEVFNLGKKKGIALEEGLLEKLTGRADSWPAEMKPSMLLDLERGRKLELESLQGAVVRLGEELGLPTPLNRFIHTALRFHAGGWSRGTGTGGIKKCH